MRAGSLALLALLFGSACANPPGWVRRTAPFKLLYWPYSSPYLENPRFSFEMKRGWKGPEAVEGGVRFRRATASISVSYHLEGSPGWKAPKAYRQWMRQQGATEDTHVVDEVALSSKTAAHVVYTTHQYDPQYLLGAKQEVLTTELLMLPDLEGVFVVRYEAAQDDFWRYRRVYERFLESLVLAVAEPKLEE